MDSKKKFEQDFGDTTTFDEDITDSNDESPNEKYILDKIRSRHVPENYDSEDEVYALQDDSDDDEDDNDKDEHDSMESDIERPQEDDNLPDERAWGKKKKMFYSADYVDADYATTNERDMEKANLEEEMAKKIQQRLAEQLDDADFGLDLLRSSISTKDDATANNEQIVKTDLSSLSKREQLTLFEKENPEFQALVTDFEDRLLEVRNILLPFLNFAKKEHITECPALTLIKIKYHLILNYSVNLSFYLELKAKKIPIISHPVIKRLAQLRQLISQLEEGQGNLIKEASEVVKAIENGEKLHNVLDNSQIHKLSSDMLIKGRTSKKLPLGVSEQIDDEDGDGKENENSSMDENASDIVGDGESIHDVEEMGNENSNYEVLEGGKRPINYKIAKNKGLTPYRKKEQRNPRVKHRNKYRKAKIRRKGAVREVKRETTRYGGEISGIKASVMKSRKLK